jgi:hypothetical protein
MQVPTEEFFNSQAHYRNRFHKWRTIIGPQTGDDGFGTRLTVDTKTPLSLMIAGTPEAGTPMP